MKKISLALYVLAFGLIISACNDPSPIGSDLLEGDQVDVFFTDTIGLQVSTVKEENVLTYDPNPSTIFDNFLVGDYNDPIFGRSVAGLYAQLTLDFDAPNYEGALLDSVVFTLQYDSINTYGDLLGDPFSVGIYQITEPINREADYFSDDDFAVDEASPLTIMSDFTPRVTAQDSIRNILDYRFNDQGDTLTLPPSLRIKLSNFFGQELLGLSDDVYSSSSNFVEQFNGIHVRPLANNSGMLSFDISSLSASGLTVYYRQDTVKTQYEYSFSSRFVQFNNFSHDYDGAPVSAFFDDTTLGDSILFIQAMAGPNVKIDIPSVAGLEDVIVNKAELEFTVAQLPGDDLNSFNPLQNMIAAELVDGTFIFLTDVLAGGTNFGGTLLDEVGENGEALMRYRMNISAHFQRIIEGLSNNSIYLRAFPKQEQSARVVIFGPGHSQYPMKLRLTYTTLN